jgi:hypothetical protein
MGPNGWVRRWGWFPIGDVFAAVNGGGAVGGEEGDEFRDFFRAAGAADGNPSE